MQLPLLVLFVVSVFSPEPLRIPDVPTPLQMLNAQYDGTNAEGWDDAMRVPLQTLPTLAASNPYRGMGNGTSDVEQWRPLVAGQFPPEQLDMALAIMKCESGGNPNADNPRSSATGLFQILASLWGPHFGFSQADLYVPELNVYAAARIWEMDGWNAWSCYRKVR